MKNLNWVRKILFAGTLLLQLNMPCVLTRGAPGDLDHSFYANLGADGRVNAIALQPDGKLIIGGTRMMVGGLANQAIARIQSDGSVDPSFAVDPNGWITDVGAILLLPDGKLLVGYNNGIIRLNPGGTPDTSFRQPTIINDGVFTGVGSIVVQPDGKTLIGGLFRKVDDIRRDGIARLNTDGSLDISFNPGKGVSNPLLLYTAVTSIALQPDGKALIAGNFSHVHETSRNGIARLNPDGSLDTSFAPGTGVLEVASLALQPDGRILIAGTFNNVNSVSRNSVARLNANGSVDSSFDPGSGLDGGYALSMALQSDGKPVIGGRFLTINGVDRNHIARLNTNGSLDGSFEPSEGPHPYIFALALQRDGKVIFGGSDIDGTVADDRVLTRLHGNFPAPSPQFTNLHNFADYHGEGAAPVGSLVLSGNILYGTTAQGGSHGYGTVFKVNADGSGFTNLYSFTGTLSGKNSDGANPRAGLVLSGNTLYGTASVGGSHGYGTVFAINTDGANFTTLHSFDGFEGMSPVARLTLSGDTLYGTTRGDSENVFGTVFAIRTNGAGFTNLYSFDSNGGYEPLAGLVSSGDTLYGTARSGGQRFGVVFAINTNGLDFTNLHSFTGEADGAFPYSELVLSGDTLYGTTFGADFGGPVAGSHSTVFKVTTNGANFATLHRFPFDLSDGFYPTAGLTLSGQTLYGTTHAGGAHSSGAVFAINTDGTDFRTVYDFPALPEAGGPPYTNSAGANPSASLIMAGDNLYGTASKGGSFGSGTVFSVLLPSSPQLTITRSGANVTLTWPAIPPGLTLQSTTNLLSGVAWSTVAQGVVTNAGQISVTVSPNVEHMFFRLKSP